MTDDLKDILLSFRQKRTTAHAIGPSVKTTRPKAPTKGRAKAKSAPGPAATFIPEIVGEEVENGIKEIDPKRRLTFKEQRFIELYLTGESNS